MSGCILLLSVFTPRRLMAEPPPTWPELVRIVSPAALPCSTSVAERMGSASSWSAVIWDTVVPISRRRTFPTVPVATTASSAMASVDSSKFAVTV